MGKLPTMRSDNSEILPYNFKDYFVFIGTEKLSDHPNFCMFNHWHDETEIIVPLKGHMTYNINGDLIKPNSLRFFRRQHRLCLHLCTVAPDGSVRDKRI